MRETVQLHAIRPHVSNCSPTTNWNHQPDHHCRESCTLDQQDSFPSKYPYQSQRRGPRTKGRPIPLNIPHLMATLGRPNRRRCSPRRDRSSHRLTNSSRIKGNLVLETEDSDQAPVSRAQEASDNRTWVSVTPVTTTARVTGTEVTDQRWIPRNITVTE